MRLKTMLLGTALALASVLPASAADEIYIPLLTYRTGGFAVSGIPIGSGPGIASTSVRAWTSAAG